MKTTIFCFSGTGNSYYAATAIAEQLGDTTVRMTSSLLDAENIEMTERVGFLFPTYKGFPPNQMKDFIQEVFSKQDLEPIRYLFMITTRYKFQAYSMVAMEVLLREAGCAHSYANHIVMPDGYVPLVPVPTEEKESELYAQADRSIRLIVEDIQNETIKLAGKRPFSRLALNYLMGFIHSSSKLFARKFTVTDACTSCKICYRMCPSANITMVEGKPVFGDNCEGCLGCYHRCPEDAIQLTTRAHEGRYRNKRSGYNMEYRI
ncbi:MAG TPA: 4Fe-4S ferredoxin [Spirochaetales bacterium]|jgi:Pyruvate/2-oxoacid:ferredoxin oxidoreductase delta subunit/flavodoxin|nr:4Fe-4S ferredoxin [Spirochaetales bacterium]